MHYRDSCYFNLYLCNIRVASCINTVSWTGTTNRYTSSRLHGELQQLKLSQGLGNLFRSQILQQCCRSHACFYGRLECAQQIKNCCGHIQSILTTAIPHTWALKFTLTIDKCTAKGHCSFSKSPCHVNCNTQNYLWPK